MILPVLVLYVTSTLCVMTSAEPKLSLKVTRDVTLTCTMAGFDRNMSRLVSLQIIAIPMCGNDSPDVFASVDHRGAFTSMFFPYSHQPFYRVSGELHSKRERDSWLKLTIYDYKRRHGYVGFGCRINYLEQPADRQQSSGEVSVPVNTSHKAVSTRHHEGFNKTVRRGVHAVCENNETMSYSALVNENGTILASSSGYDSNPSFMGSHTTRFYNYKHGVFEAHLPDISCEESWKCHCSVRTSAGSLLTSSSQALPRNDCPQETGVEIDPSPPSEMTKSNGLNTAETGVESDPSEMTKSYGLNTAETAPLKHFTVGILVSVFVAVIIVAVIGFVILRLRKARRACFKTRRRPGEYDSDDASRESLNGDSATKNKTKDVDVRKSAEEQSLSVNSDQASVASSITDMRLHLRPETYNV